MGTDEPKSVHFASEIEGRYMRYPSLKEIESKWYSHEDYANFKQQMTRDIVLFSRAMAADIDNHTDKQVIQERLLIGCVGLDHLISRNVTQRYSELRASRKEHVRIVLDEQKLQRRRGVSCLEDLASVSMGSSLNSRERSHRVAKMVGWIR